MSCTTTAQRRIVNASLRDEYIIILILTGRKKLAVLKYKVRLLPYQPCGVYISMLELGI